MYNTENEFEYFQVGSLFVPTSHLLLFKNEEKLNRYYGKNWKTHPTGTNKPDRFVFNQTETPMMIILKKDVSDEFPLEIWQILYEEQSYWLHLTKADLFSLMLIL